jgi:sugar phosphate isomerase/epimerase
MTNVTRRQFLKNSALAAAAASLNPFSLTRAAGKEIPIGVQLYSVRGDCAKDFDAALAQIAKMGFKGVEFAGYHKYGGKAKELRQKLDDLGLKGISAHIGTGTLRGDALKGTIEFHKIIGCKFLIVPHDGAFTDPEKSKELAETFNKTAEVLKPLGMACGYHNHMKEFTKVGDKTYYDLFAERTTTDVVLEQDCGWSAAAGLQPADLMKKFPGRTKLVHFKPTVIGGDKTKKAIFGEDSVDWVSTLAACRTVGGTEWLLIEQEVYPDGKSPMECTELSLAGLKKIL